MNSNNAFKIWLETDSGKSCMRPCDFTKPGQLDYLENRLWHAYTEGIKNASALSDGWVKVEDGLPKVETGHATEITICSHIFDADEPMVVASGVFYEGNFYLCSEWRDGDLDMIVPITPGRITHWMPLPSPPKQ